MSDKKLNSLVDFLEHYEKTFKSTLSMHASESPMSLATKYALSHDLCTRYSAEDPGNDLVHGDMIFGGSSALKLLKDICREELKNLLECEYVSFTPLSGLNAANIAVSSFTSPGDTVLFVSAKHGGHPVFPAIAESYNLKYKYIPFNDEDMEIDWSALEELFYETKAALLYIDASDFLFPFDLTKFSKPQNINAICVFDISHVLGFVGAKEMLNPLNYGFDAIVGSTHKSFPGPHKAVFGTRDKKIIDRFEKVCKIKVSSTHSHHILALTVALLEFREQGKYYTKQIIKNGNAFGKSLFEQGLTPFQKNGSFTKTHQVWLPFDNYEYGINAYRKLERTGIYANFIKLHYGLNWGIRFGMQEITFHGFKSEDVKKLGKIASRALRSSDSYDNLKSELKNLIERVTPYWKSSPIVFNLLKLKNQ